MLPCSVIVQDVCDGTTEVAEEVQPKELNPTC